MSSSLKGIEKTITVLKVDEIIQCGDQFLLKSNGELHNSNDFDVLDISQAHFRLEVGTNRKGHFGKKMVKILLEQQEWMCLICFCDLRIHEPHVDHMVPLSFGGTNNISNLCALCSRCNQKKGSRIFKSVDSFREIIQQEIKESRKT